ncbi:N-acetyltransferase [Sinorhizobium meliloti WSM1022]|jgi:predicted N-acetyltransferase YhbS|uniref:GNAT family N-acetyltransferase n=1 Tax=Rhizobium meliloti TaxID=382 RepID=UPI000416F4A1|nr:N-acetyltransferase [Sinorhizobium meliloti]ASQ02812.1 N-acetyltransferase [Sinorhizobium meliloti]MCO6421131.1 N-acetyltransferase [Sinorhizobium meliloti]MDW9408505.1 GNAT family N-acetyltransferase [Sinorhizobium meliloti]MDW9441250.1 GNAT family N-acetyltransferase [Sinorhizobium meliloti]MDW9453741.1 GNAT family N-acetyltransferase [Sinorhizobium meliloti]
MAAVVDSLRAFFAPTTFVIDSENPGDVVARENLLDRAMGAGRRRKSSEKLRRGRVPAEGLALVARDADGHVIGTVRLWNVEAGVNREGQAVPALLLGPLAVDPAHEGKGIGGMLMRAAVQEAKNRGHGAVLLVGAAAYYERFGFFAQRAQHLVMPGPFERNRFLALELKEGWLDGAAGMLVASGRKLALPPLRRAA